MKKLISLLMICSCFALTACDKGNATSENVAPTEPPIRAYEKEIVVTTPAPTEAPEEEKVLVPVIEQNVSDEIDLSITGINNYLIDIDDLTLEQFCLMTGLHKSQTGLTSFDTSTLYWDSGMFCLNNGGTMTSVEVVDTTGKLVECADVDDADYTQLFVKGIYCSAFWLKEDYPVTFYAGLKSGDSEELLISLLGNGVETNRGERVYRNSTHTMIVECETQTNEQGETIRVVDGITLLKN